MGELFIAGDPRLLSGGRAAREMSYTRTPPTVETVGGTEVCTKTCAALGPDPFAAAHSLGQVVHSGKVGYHHTPRYNTFLRDGEWPSAGVELETHLRRCDEEFDDAAKADMRSNWFHFERDGSLDRAHGGDYGYELITEPLPPRAYRNPRLWFGLQNAVSPWLKSFECEETGLHVHVGLSQFEGIDALPLTSAEDRRSIGKAMSAIVYYCIADQAFVDRVALRRTTGYCNVPDIAEMSRMASTAATGAELVDRCVSMLTVRADVAWQRAAKCALDRELRDTASAPRPGAPSTGLPTASWVAGTYLAGGHGTEINHEHPYTVEFRRAKGTLHALSVHRIVELMTSIVRFAGKLCREPDFVATRESFMDWLISTTTSEALRNLAKQTKG